MAALRRLTHWWHHVVEHVSEDWPAIVFVPAVIFVLHHHHWLQAIDGYAFLLVGNLSAMPTPLDDRASANPKQQGAVVVLIDAKTHEQRYLERSPLHRCRLRDDLQTIYDAKPDRVAIDLDLSPAIWLEPPSEAVPGTRDKHQLKKQPPAAASERQTELGCQRQLYSLIKKNNKDGIKTTLMTPFEVSDAGMGSQRAWQAEMEAAGVRFGRADLPIDYGLVINQYTDFNSFAAAVLCTLEKRPAGCDDEKKKRDQTERHTSDTTEATGSPEASKRQLINPRQYRTGVCPVPLTATAPALPSDYAAPASGRRADTLCPLDSSFNSGISFPVRLANALKPLKDKAVFFGAAYGTDDVFLTPLGELYGVEIQAAGYLTRLDPITDANQLLSFLADVAMAAIFGYVFARCWSLYFRRRLSDNALDRQTAFIYVLILVAWFAILVPSFCLLSLIFLRTRGVWLSPVPIAAGMLIDCFVSGSVQEAVREASRTRRATVVHLNQSFSSGDFADAVKTELKHQRPPVAGFWQSVGNFVVRDWQRLRASGQYAAAFWLGVHRVVWFAVTGWVVYTVFHD